MDLFDNNSNGFKPTNSPPNQAPKGFPTGSPNGVSKGGFKVEEEAPRKTGKVVKIISGILVSTFLLGGIGYGGLTWYQKQEETKQAQQAEQSRYDNLANQLQLAITSFKLGELIGEGDQSAWDLNVNYAKNDHVMRFLNRVVKHIKVDYNSDSREVTLTYPNWQYIAWVSQAYDADKLAEVGKGLDPKAHDYLDKLQYQLIDYVDMNLDMMLEQRDSYNQQSIKDGELKPYVTLTLEGWYNDGKLSSSVSDQLDNAIFSSKDLHNFLDVFGAMTAEQLGKRTETKEHADWSARKKILDNYIAELRKLVEEPVLVPYDKDGKVLTDKQDVSILEKTGGNNPYWVSSNNVVIKALDALRELYLVEPKRYEFEKPDNEITKILPYSFVGVSYIKSDESDAVSKNVVKGDGSFEAPYTLGTPFVTKMKSTDGNYYNVKVTLTSVVTDEQAIAEAQTFDEKNQGFTMESELRLGSLKFTVENLEDKEIEVNSEWGISDKDLNVISRTGSMFSYRERAKIPARGTVEMSDWLYARELHTSALIWGKTFNRNFPAVFLNALGNEVYDENGLEKERVERETVTNEAQETQNKLEEQASESSGQ